MFEGNLTHILNSHIGEMHSGSTVILLHFHIGIGQHTYSAWLLQVLPEVVQFMDKVHGKMMLVQTNLGKLEIEGDGAANPATKEPGPHFNYYSCKCWDSSNPEFMSNQGPTSKLSHGLQPRLMKDWDSVRLNLKQVFQSLAEIKADMTIGDSDAAESEQFTWLHLYLTWIAIYLGFRIANLNRIQEKIHRFCYIWAQRAKLTQRAKPPKSSGLCSRGNPTVKTPWIPFSKTLLMLDLSYCQDFWLRPFQLIWIAWIFIFVCL